MPDLGKYAVEVLAAYGVSLTLLVAITVMSWRSSRRQKAALEATEARLNG